MKRSYFLLHSITHGKGGSAPAHLLSPTPTGPSHLPPGQGKSPPPWYTGTVPISYSLFLHAARGGQSPCQACLFEQLPGAPSPHLAESGLACPEEELSHQSGLVGTRAGSKLQAAGAGPFLGGIFEAGLPPRWSLESRGSQPPPAPGWNQFPQGPGAWHSQARSVPGARTGLKPPVEEMRKWKLREVERSSLGPTVRPGVGALGVFGNTHFRIRLPRLTNLESQIGPWLAG